MAVVVFGEKLENIQYRERPSVYAIIFNQDGYIGLVKVQGKSKYFLPGGGQENDETDAECLTRECREELGYNIKIFDYIGSTEYYSYCTPMQCYLKVIGKFYLAELGEVNEGKVEDDHELIWLKPEDTQQNMMLKHQQWAIKEVLINRRENL